MSTINARKKGQRGERKTNEWLRSVFPKISRNWQEQSAKGGVDHSNTGNIDIETKCGKQCDIKKVEGWLKQVADEGDPTNLDLVVCWPDRKPGYVILPVADFYPLLEIYIKETT